jgi:hypothetical protein
MNGSDEGIDRVRRRLLKLTAYVPPMILSLRAERAHAERLAPTAAAKAGVAAKASAAVQVQVQVQAKTG